MRKSKCFLALCLALLMALSMTSWATGDAGQPEIREFQVFDFGEGRLKDHPMTEDPVGRAITEKTGVLLTYDRPVGDYTDSLVLMIAGEDYPDLVSHTGNTYQTLVEAGALKPLKEKIMGSPNILDLFGAEIGKLAYSTDNPEFYAFGNSPREAGPYTPNEYYENGFYIQLDALAQAGYPVLKSWQDYEDVIAAYLEANPTVNGMPTVGISFAMADGWRYQFSILNTLTNTSDFASDQFWHVDEETFEVTATLRQPEAKEFYKWLNHLNDIGLLDPETFTQSHDDYEAKVANGRLIGFMDASWQVYNGIAEAASTWPERNYIGFPILMDPDTMQWRDLQSKGLVTAGGLSVTVAVNDADLDLIVSFFDFLASDEGLKLRCWGIEGEHYTFDPDDTSKDWQGTDASPRRVDPYVWSMRYDTMSQPTVRWTTGVDKYPEFYPIGGGHVFKDGYLVQDHPVDTSEYYEAQSDYLKDFMTHYGIIGLNQMFPIGYPYILDQTTHPILLRGPVYNLPFEQNERCKVIFESYKDLIVNRSGATITASPENFEAEWDRFMNDLERVGIVELEQEITRLLAERMTLWGVK